MIAEVLKLKGSARKFLARCSVSLLAANDGYSHTLYLSLYLMNRRHKDLNWMSVTATIFDLFVIHRKLFMTH